MKKTNKKNDIEQILNRTSDFKIYELIILAVLIASASVLITIVTMSKSKCSNITTKNYSSDKNLSEFEEVYDLINTSYYKKADKTKLVNGAIDGMLSSLDDPHTSYFTKSETESFNEIMSGSYEGIGAEISMDQDKNVVIITVFKNSPAAEVGLKFGDIITEVNGQSTEKMTSTEVVTHIKDSEKKTADIKIKRNGEELEFTLPKRIVEIESVESKTYDRNDKKIGYIEINNFANNTYSQFKQQLEELENKNISGLVIDVRGNSGGYLTSVTNMLDLFLNRGTVVYQIADRSKTVKYTAATTISRNYPVAVLVNKSSASASEILAIGLKESYDADVVGTYTYGKGTVQTTKTLSNGAMIKYTIQKWLSPNGNWINKKGVAPTISVELSKNYEENPSEENDNQLQTALNTVSK